MEAAAKTSVMPAASVAADGAEKANQPTPDPKGERKPVKPRHDEKWKIFSGTANDVLAKRVCDFLGLPLGQTCITKFSDGETYV